MANWMMMATTSDYNSLYVTLSFYSLFKMNTIAINDDNRLLYVALWFYSPFKMATIAIKDDNILLYVSLSSYSAFKLATVAINFNFNFYMFKDSLLAPHWSHLLSELSKLLCITIELLGNQFP